MLVDVIDRLEAHYSLACYVVRCLLCLGFHGYNTVMGLGERVG